MLEALGRLHPIAIHFPLALLISGGALSLCARLVRREDTQNALQAAAIWNFWIGAMSLGPALLTGWAAYQTVAHDAPSHAAMTLHRNWALATSGVFIVLAAFAWRGRDKRWPSGWLMGSVLLVGLSLLVSTGFRGGELVFRHGLGVQSLPAPEGEGQVHGSEGHRHGDGQEQDAPKPTLQGDAPAKTTPKPPHHDAAPHKH